MLGIFSFKDIVQKEKAYNLFCALQYDLLIVENVVYGYTIHLVRVFTIPIFIYLLECEISTFPFLILYILYVIIYSQGYVTFPTTTQSPIVLSRVIFPSVPGLKSTFHNPAWESAEKTRTFSSVRMFRKMKCSKV